MPISVTYISEMIVCHAIYQLVINKIRKRTVVFLWEGVVYNFTMKFIKNIMECQKVSTNNNKIYKMIKSSIRKDCVKFCSTLALHSIL